jgi:CRISPR-associated protein Cmr4
LILGLFAETPIHPGSGQALDVIQLPIAREATTEYPMIPGSSLKGALRNKLEQEQSKQEVEPIFGSKHEVGRPDTEAGRVVFSDARLLLLPIRSLRGHYRWITCPYLLERFNRDCKLLDLRTFSMAIQVNKGEALVAQQEEPLFLEESVFTCRQESNLSLLAMVFESLIGHPPVQRRLQKQLVILHDDDFAYFARYGLPVRARNQLNEQTKESENLWHEETLPPDTLMYTLLMPRPGHQKEWKFLQNHLQEHPYIQVGGNETLGHGWFISSIFKQGEC